MTKSEFSFLEYQRKAKTFRLPTADENYVLMNWVAETGEFFGHLAKAIRDETQIDGALLAKEIGDVLWHLSALCDDMGIELADVAQANLEKLESRQIRGKIMGSGDNR